MTDEAKPPAKKRGGFRPGSGRKPKKLAYKTLVRCADDEAAKGLPGVMRKMVYLAQQGDVQAARLIVERILGRPAPASVPASEDASPPIRSASAISAMAHSVYGDLSDRALQQVKNILLDDLTSRGLIDPENTTVEIGWEPIDDMS